MEELILRSRKFNLRWAVVILIIAIIIANILGNLSGELIKWATFIQFGGFILFYATWCAQAVNNLKKASRTLTIILVAYFLNATWILLSEPVDEARMTTLNILLYMQATSSYPTALLQWLASAGAFIYSFSSVNQKYRLCWGGMILIFLLNFMNLFVLVTGSATIDGSGVFYHGVDTYVNTNNVIGVLELGVYITLLIKGSNTFNNREEKYISSSNEPKPCPTAANISTSETNDKRTDDYMQRLFQLKELLDAGVLTQEEFDTEKAKI